MRNILVTGGAGFIGSNLIRRWLAREAEVKIVNLDLLTYAGNLENLCEVENSRRYKFVRGSITEPADVARAAAAFGANAGVDAIVNLAAQTHVDRSIDDAVSFVDTNVKGTLTLLEYSRRNGVRRFVQVSTDEVYGSLGPAGKFTEQTPLDPSSAYSASKAGADLLVQAYHRTYGLDVVITRCSNNYGPYQFPEKLLPLMITNLLEGKPLPVYGDGKNVRDWIHVDDHADGIWLTLTQGKSGSVYNFGGDAERANIDLVRALCAIAKADATQAITYVKDRPGHDRRYAMDFSFAARELGFKPTRDIDAELPKLFAWYEQNREWWQRVRSGAYRDYYDRLYGAGGRHDVGVAGGRA